MTTNELMAVRYKVIADYPKSNFKIGEILECEDMVTEAYLGNPMYKMYPHLFKKLEWWQERGVDVLKQVKFVKVVKYRGYWLVGDIVPAKLKIDDEFVPIGYYLRGQHYQPVFELEPATESEYITLNK